MDMTARPRYRAVEKVTFPSGLGIVDEFRFTKANTKKPIKATCPGPVTMTIHVRPGNAYKSRLDLSWQLTEVINAELKALVSEGAEFIQLDEPSFAIVPGELDEWVRLYNACIDGVEAKHALHICFGNLMSRPRGKRSYGWMFPALNNVNADQLVLEFANREMSEADIWKQFDGEKELGAGVVDIKSFYLETAEDVAERIRAVLQHVPAEKLHLNPDCGFFQLPRWISYLKLKALVDGARVVRGELGDSKAVENQAHRGHPPGQEAGDALPRRHLLHRQPEHHRDPGGAGGWGCGIDLWRR